MLKLERQTCEQLYCREKLNEGTVGAQAGERREGFGGEKGFEMDLQGGVKFPSTERRQKAFQRGEQHQQRRRSKKVDGILRNYRILVELQKMVG